MKLEEQMLKVTDELNKYPMCFDTANQCTKIAEDFAIGFAEWIRENYYDTGEYWCKWNKDSETYTSEQLLTLYKQTL